MIHDWRILPGRGKRIIFPIQLPEGQGAVSENLVDLLSERVTIHDGGDKVIPFSKKQWGDSRLIKPGVRPVIMSGESNPKPSANPDTDLAKKEREIQNAVRFLEEVYRGTSYETALSDNVRDVLQKIGVESIQKSKNYAVGSTLREVAKKLFSRWGVIEPQFRQNEPFLLLWNTVEESRAGNMLKSMYPTGVKDFFGFVYHEDFLRDEALQQIQNQIVDIIQEKNGNISREEAEKMAEEAGYIKPLPKFVQYVKGVLYEFFAGKEINWNDPFSHPAWIKDKDVIAALSKTARDYRSIMRSKQNLFGKILPEDEIEKQAKQAYEDVRDKLWPVYKELLDEDQQKLAEEMKNGQGQPQPGSGQPQPGSGQPQPGSGQPQPGSGQPQPGSGQPQPGSGQPQPGSGQPQPGSGQGLEDQMKTAQDVIDEISKRLSRQLETKDDASRRNPDANKPQQGQQGQGQQGQRVPQPGNGDEEGESVEDAQSSGMNGEQADQAGEGTGAEGESEGDSQSQQVQVPHRGLSTSEVEQRTLQELRRRKMLAEAHAMQPTGKYRSYYAEVYHQSQQLASILANIFEKNAKPRPVRGQKKPGIVDMPAVVQYQAKAAKGEVFDNPPIWKIKQEPKLRDHAVVFVMDLSGSMSGEKKEQAIKSWIMCAEALEQNHVPWALIIFSSPQWNNNQDPGYAIVKDFNDTWDDKRRENTIEKIDAFPMNGTNDWDAVKVGVKMVEDKHVTGVRLVIPISDGEGKKEEMKKLVKEADHKRISVIGVAIDAVEYFKDVYIHHAVARNLEALPSVLGSVIRERFRATYGQ